MTTETHCDPGAAPVPVWQRLSGSRSAVALVLVVSLALTGWAWLATLRNHEKLAGLRFAQQVEVFRNRIAERLSDCEQGLRSASGLFASDGVVTRAGWHGFVEALRPENKFAGVQGIGFSLRIPREGLAAHLRAVRAEGFPLYTVHPEYPRPEYHSVVYLEPFRDRNLRAFGYDMSTEAVRRQAMESARDTGACVMSGRVTLVQEIPGQPVQPGFLVYLPVYHRERPHQTVAERRANLHGFVYSPFRAGDFFDKLVFLEPTGIGLRIYSKDSPGPGDLLYDSTASAKAEPVRPDFRSRHTDTQRITLLGQPWRIAFMSLPAFESAQDRSKGLLTLAIGLACSALATGIVYAQGKRNQALAREARTATDLRRARDELELRIAERTAQLSRANAELERDIERRRKTEAELARVSSRFQMLLRVASDGIHIMDGQGNLTESSDSFRRMLGYSGDETAGLNVRDWDARIPVHELLPRIQELMRQPALFETLHRRKDGTVFPVEINARGIEVEGRILLYASARDITERKQAENAVHESERRFAAMADAAPVLIWASGTDKLCNYFNKVWLDFTGRTLGQEMGNGWAEGVHPDDFANCLKIYSGSFDVRQPFRMEYRLRRADGHYRWILDTGVPRYGAEGTFAGYIGSCIDITEKRENEELLRLRGAAISAAASAIVITDVQGAILWVNEAFTRVTGYSITEVIGQKPSLLKSGLQPREFYEQMWGTVLSGQIWRGQLRNKRKDGTLFDEELVITPLKNPQGVLTHFIAIKTDITERRRTEDALRESEAYNRSIVESSLDAIITMNPDGLITSWNGQAELVFGWSGGEAIGRRLSETIVPPALRERHEAGLGRLLAGGAPHITNQRLELVALHRDGREFPIELSIVPVNLNNTRQFNAFIRDITERRRLLEQTRQDARTKSDLLREVNHRVTNNLTSILGLLVGENSSLSPADGPVIKPVIDRLAQRIRGLLSAHRLLSDSQWAPVRLDELAELVVRAALAADPDRHETRVSIAPMEEQVSPRQASNVALILNELTTNSIKHRSARGAPIHISVDAGIDGEFVLLRYEDNGPGFPAEVLAGYRSNIGLQLVRQLVTETLRGTVTFANNPGARITMRLRIEEGHRT